MKLAEIFAGKFKFTRVILPQSLKVEGEAGFTEQATNKQKLYLETGTYLLNSKDLGFTQRQYFLFEVDSFSIFKADHSLLHKFDLSNVKDINEISFPLKFSNCHLCKADKYSITIKILSANEFSIHYKIKGPNKDYSIETNFVRLR